MRSFMDHKGPIIDSASPLVIRWWCSRVPTLLMAREVSVLSLVRGVTFLSIPFTTSLL